MATNFNALSSDPFGFNLESDYSTSLLLPPGSGLGHMNQTHSHGYGGNSYHQLLASNPNTNPGVPMSEVMITPRSQSTLTIGQLGLNQRVAEVRRRTLVGTTPHRVQVHSIVEFNPCQNLQPSSVYPTGEVTVTEIVRTTKFLTPASTLDHLLMTIDNGHLQCLSSNINGFDIERQYNLPNHNLNDFSNCNGFVLENQLLDPPPIPPPPRHHPSRSIIPSLMAAMDVGYLPNHQSNRVVLQPEPKPEPETIFVPITNNHNLIPCQNHQQPDEMVASCESNGNGFSYSDEDVTTADEYYSGGEEVFLGKDGKTHSLPHRKYGPYTCPRCRNKFSTSQGFAAHMLSHYKNETIDERKRRLVAKYKRKNNLHLCNLQRGSTTALKIKNVAMKIKNKLIQGGGVGEGNSGGESHYVMINDWKIKEEPK